MYDFPIKIINSGHSLCSAEWTTAHEQTVPFFRIYYVHGGRAQVGIRGVRYELLPENVYFIPGLYPFINECRKFMDVYWFHALPLSPFIESVIGRIDKAYCWKMSELNFYRKTILSLASADILSHGTEWMELQSFVTYLLSTLMHVYGTEKASFEIPSNFRKSFKYMDSAYIENPSLEQIASYACLAPNYFHRTFKRYFGMTPHEYMEKKRMVLARTQLFSSDKPLSEIAEECGYENSFYFSRVFKKHFHLSPGKARKTGLIP